jgi:hypothetical protein
MDSPFNARRVEKVELPPLRAFVVESFDPVTEQTSVDTYMGHGLIEKESGSLWVIEVQILPFNGQPVERVVKVIPSGEWDSAHEDYTPSSTLIN